jgi:hypothetical protein
VANPASDGALAEDLLREGVGTTNTGATGFRAGADSSDAADAVVTPVRALGEAVEGRFDAVRYRAAAAKKTNRRGRSGRLQMATIPNARKPVNFTIVR